MPVTNDFTGSTLNLNGEVSFSSGPTALDWGADGRLYVTQQKGEVQALSIDFGDVDNDGTLEFYVTEAETILGVQNIPNFNDDGSSTGGDRQVTGIATGLQYDSSGDVIEIDGKPAVVLYVTSSDARIGAGGGGGDTGLDTNSGTITRLVQTDTGWDVTDIVRGLSRSEENHALNGLELLQEVDDQGNVSERLIVASGGNANTGAPSNNFAGQQETAYSAAILEIDLDQIAAIELADGLKTDNGRPYVYDVPTLNDVTQPGDTDVNDPFGGNDGFNQGKLTADGPVQIYSAGYRNSYDVEVTEDGRVWTYDNGANNNWGGRPAGEDFDGDQNATEAAELNGTPEGYIATNLAINDNDENPGFPGNQNFNPQNWDQFHEVTRSDDLEGRILSAGQGGAQVYTWEHPDNGTLQLVYGGHPNPTRAEGARAGLLYSPKSGITDSRLLVSNEDKGGGSSDFLEVVAWLSSLGFSDDYIDRHVIAVEPGKTYADPGEDNEFDVVDDVNVPNPEYWEAPSRPTEAGIYTLPEDVNGEMGLPSDIDEVVNALNPIEGDYREAGFTDGAIDTDKGSVNGLAEYTSSIFDDVGNGVQMQGSIIAADLNGGVLHVLGREADGAMQSSTEADGRSVAADKQTIGTDVVDGAPLGLASIGDDLTPHDNVAAFRGTIWSAVYKQNGPFIQVLQPGNPEDNALLPAYAGSEFFDPTDQDLDGIDYIADPFEYSPTNGIPLQAGQQLVLDFNQTNLQFPGTLGDTGLLGAMIDGVTPNADEGLFDNAENLILGANAPILNIKDVKGGTAVGSANTGVDMLQTGLNLSADVQRVEVELDSVNWVNVYDVGGRMTGVTFSDGTQFNFVRFAYGDIGGGTLGFIFGIETDDVYSGQTIVADQTFIDALTVGNANVLDNKIVELRLDIDTEDYTVTASYRIAGEIPWTDVGTPVNLPENGTLRAVLDGTHTVSDSDSSAPSGVGIGLFAEDLNTPGSTPDDVFTVDFPNIRIEGIGNEIAASTEAEAEAPGTPEIDTVIYDGTETGTIDLDDAVENFEGDESDAAYGVVGNALDNKITVGSGANTIATGEGTDEIIGSLSDLDGDTITDFSSTDKVVVTDKTTASLGVVTYGTGSATLTIDNQTITFDSEQFDNFDPADGPTTFAFNDGANGLEITVIPDETVIYRVNAGATLTAIDGGIDWVGDNGLGATPTNGVAKIGGKPGTFSNAITDAEDEVDFDNVDPLIVPWQVFVDERGQGLPSAAAVEYTFAVEVGASYKIEYFYTENWQNIFAGGPREFDVQVEGEVPAAFEDLNPFAEAVAFVGAPPPTSNGAPASEKQPYNGVARKAEHIYTATDDTLNIALVNNVQEAKVNAIQITQLGGTFTPPADTTAPVIESISVENPESDQDSPRLMTVVVSDNAGFNQVTLDALDGSELSFTDIEPASISNVAATLSNGGQTATIVYTLEAPALGWPQATLGQVDIAADAYADAEGNGSAAASATFASTPNLSNLTGKGSVVFAVNVGPTTNTIADLAGDDDNTYGGAITNDPIIGVDLQADDPSWYSPSSKTGSNIDGLLGSTGSNPALDGSALHTYRDSANADMTATYPVSNGIYVVELWFAELFHATGGNRQGDYTINGEVLATDFDAFNAASGADTPTVLTKTVVVTDGELVVDVDADSGQPGWNAIVVYNALPSDTPATITVGDAVVAEGGDAEVVFSRTGDTTEEITVTFTVTANDPATADDFTPPQSFTATIGAGAIASAPVLIPIVDDDDEEGAETLTVEVTGLAGDPAAVGVGATGTVTISPSDSTFQIPAGGTILELDFETPGDPLVEGGFDGLLGGSGGADAAGNAVIVNGELQLNTSNGDLSQDPVTASKNDFVKSVDLSSATLETVFLTTAFDMPFSAGTPNYVQQGIIISTGDEATQQNPLQFQKLIVGGNGGDAIQVWAQGGSGAGTDGVVLIGAVSTAAVNNGGQAFTFDDVATVELSMEFDKVADTTGVWVTYFDDQGAVLGGVRPTATPGFATLAPVVTPPAVVAAIDDGTSVVGVTSTDFPTAEPSFLATWDYLTVSSPEFVDVADTDGPTGVAAITLPGARDGDIVVTVTYTDASDVDPVSIDANDVTLSGPTAPAGAPTVAFDEVTNIATYTFAAPVEGWANGDYTASVQAGEVADLADPANTNIAGAGTTETLEIFDSPTDVTPPTAFVNLVLPDTAEGDIVVTLTVADETALDTSSVEVGDILLTPPQGVTLGTPAFAFDEQTGIATYTFSAPQDGWPNGTYAASVNSGVVADLAGNTNVNPNAVGGELDLAPPLPPGTVVFAVNAGGASIDDPAYGLGDAIFQEDTTGNPNAAVDFSNVTTGNPNNNGNNANNNGAGQTYTGLTLPDTIFTSERFGDDLSYNIDLPDGDYVVELYFAETFLGVNPNAPEDPIGKRLFDVDIEGVKVLDDYDLYDDGDGVIGNDAGAPLVKIVKTFDATVSDGQLNIVFNATLPDGADNAKISGIVIRTPIPPQILVSIAGEVSVVENGDGTAQGDNQDLVFTLTSEDGLTGTLDLTLDIDGQTNVLTDVAFDAGTATVTVPVATDTLWNDSESVSVTLVSVETEGYDVDGDAASATTTVTEDDPADSYDLDGDGAGAPVVVGDFSGDNLAPTDIGTLAEGATEIVASQQGDNAAGGRERDYITFTVAEGQVLSGIIVKGYVGGDTSSVSQGFMGLAAGNSIPLTQSEFESNFPDGTGLLGGYIYSESDVLGVADSDGNVLDELGDGEEQGYSFPGFTGSLPAGTYTLWLNQGADNPSTVTLDLVIEPAPFVLTLSIADADPVVEAGDLASDLAQLQFALTLNDPLFTGQMEVTYTVDTVEQSPITIDFTDGAGTLIVEVPSDAVFNGDETVSVELVSATDQALVDPEPVEISTASASATGSVTEDDADDIDGDGILNIDDPFAYDGLNGDARVLLPGGEFTQDFNTDTSDPFSAEGGFSGILVNPGFDYAPSTGDDPYGPRTTESKVSISGGTLSVTSSNFDAFNTGTGANNTLADGYQSAVDVTGTTKFEVHARANSADWLATTTSTGGFEQFGITLGAGGTDDFVKLVISDNNNAGNAGTGAGFQRVQLAHNNSVSPLTGPNEDNYVVGNSGGPAIDLSLVGDIEFRLIVDRAAGDNGQVSGQVDFFASADGALLLSFPVPAVDILADSSLLAAMDGLNPLTNDDGGLAYGIFVSDWSGGSNEITANYDFLTIRSLDPNAAPTVDQGIGDQTADEEASFSFEVPADAFADDGSVANLTFSAQLTGGDDLPDWLSFDPDTRTFTGTPAQDDVGPLTIEVSADDGTNDPVSTEFILTVQDVNDAPTAVVITPLQPNVTEVAENTDTTGGIVVATIAVTDDTVGTNTLQLTGTDADKFEITTEDGVTQLVLKEGTLLDFETLAQFDVTVEVDDTTVGDTPDATADYSLTITDVNEAPSVVLENVVTEINELADVSARIKVADIVVTDDALGTETLGLTGDDAVLFVIEGTELFLEANSVLDSVGNASLDVTVTVDDTEIGVDVDDTAALQITVTPPVNEAPVSVTLENIVSLPENTDTTAAVKVADIVVVDDGIAELTLELIGDDNGLFEIGGTEEAPELLLKAGTALDFETQSSFMVSVSATDADGSVSSAELGALVTNSDERDLPPAGDPEDLPTEGTDEIDTVEYTGTEDVGTEQEPYELPDDLENFDATGTGSVNVQGNEEDNEIGVGSGGNDVVDLDGNENDDLTDDGSDAVSGTAAELDGTMIKGFGTDDSVVVEGATNGQVISVQDGSTIIGIDTDGDGEIDATVTLEETYTEEEIVEEIVDGNLVITANTTPTVDQGLTGQTAPEDAVFTYVVPADAFADDGGAENLTLSATLDDDSQLPIWLSFDPDTATFSGTPENDDVGVITVKVTASDGVTPAVSTTFALDVTNTNDAPTIVGTIETQSATAGAVNQIELASLVTVEDVDVGDTPTLQARLQNGDPLPDGLSFDGTNLTVADTVPAGDYQIELYADDTQAESVQTVAFLLEVEAPLPPAIDFGGLQASSYDQQDTGPGQLVVDGTSVTLNGNLWKRFELAEPFTAGVGAYLSFTLNADNVGEIIGVTLDNDNDYDDGDNQLYQFAGSQLNVPGFDQTYNTYQAGDTTEYQIPLEQGKTYTHIALINDADQIAGTDATFTEVRLVNPPEEEVAPVAGDDSFTAVFETVTAVSVAELLANDTDLNVDDVLTITDVTGPADPAEGSVQIIAGGTAVEFTPGSSFLGTTTFTYEVTDSTGRIDTATVTVNVVEPTDDVFIIFDDDAIGPYDPSQDTPESVVEISEDGKTLTLSGNAWKKTALPEPFTVQPDSVLEVTFSSDKVPEISLIGLENDDQAIVPNQDAPLFQLGGTQPLGIYFQQIDSYQTSDGEVTYQLDLAPWAGETFSFLAFANDADRADAAGSNSIFSNIRIGSRENTAPVAEDETFEVAGSANLELPVGDLIALASDADNDVLTLESVDNEVGGVVSLEDGVVTFVPDGPGAGSFDYTVSDGRGETATGTVTVVANTPPTAVTESLETVRNTVLQIAPATLLENDFDADEGQVVSFVSVDNAVNGSVLFEDNTVFFTPNLAFIGTASFDYTVTDDLGGTDTVTVTIDVKTSSDPNSGITDIQFAEEALSSYDDQDINTAGAVITDGGTTLNLSGNTWKKLELPQNYAITQGTLLQFTVSSTEIGEIIGIGVEDDNDFATKNLPIFQLAGTQNFSAFADQEYNNYAIEDGARVYEISLADWAGQSASYLTFINDADNVAGTNSVFSNVKLIESDLQNGPPAPLPDALDATGNQTLVIDPAQLTSNDTDPNGDDLTITDVQNAVNGSVVLEDGFIYFTPTTDFSGIATFEYIVRDTFGAPAVQTVTLTVNRAPEPVDDDFQIEPGQSLFVTVQDLLSNDSDPDAGDTLDVTAVSNAVGGSVSLDDEGQVTFIPAQGFVGNASFTYEVTDSFGATSTATVNIIVGEDTGPNELINIDFSATNTQGYAGQSGSGSAIPSQDGTELTLDGNIWRSLLLPEDYEIQEDSVLKFDLTSPSIGEIIAIGLDNNNSFTGNQPLYQLGGSQNWPAPDDTYRNYDTPGETKTYEIPLGDFEGFVANRLVFINDADNINGTSAVFSNVQLINPPDDIAPVFDSADTVNVNENQTSVLTVEATDPDAETNPVALVYGIAGTGADDALFDIDTATGALSFKVAPDFETPGDVGADNVYNVDVTVADATTTVSQSIEVTVQDVLEPGDVIDPVVVKRINAFGAEVAATDGGPVWEADLKDVAATPENENHPDLNLVSVDPGQDRGDIQGYSGTAALPANVPQTVMDTARSSNSPFSYDIDVADLAGNGNYTVNLYFAELFPGNQAPANRIFDIEIEGITEGVLDNFDPSGSGAPGDVQVVSFDVTVFDDELNIGFLQDAVNGADNPILNGIEILSTPSIDFDAPTAALTLVNPATETDPFIIEVTLADESGIDAATLGNDDITLTIGGFPSAAIATFVDFVDGKATYSVAAPDGGWVNGTQIGVTLESGAIADNSLAVNTNAEVTGALSLEIGGGSAGGGDDVVVYRINAYGPEAAALDGGPIWAADAPGAPNVYFDATDIRGDTFGYSGDLGAIPPAVPPIVLDSARSSDAPFSYNIPTSVLGGGEDYEVRLYVAELFTGGPGDGAQAGGFRIYDATLEGFTPTQFNNIDPGTSFGADVGVLSAQVKVTDGELNIGFVQDVVQNPIVNAIEIVALGEPVDDPIDPPADPADALEILQNADGIDEDGDSTGVGGAELRIMENSNGIQSSNFGAGSFVLENTGDKDIAAVLIDFRNALYPDSVVDFDGTAGDLAFKEFGVNSDGGSGAYFDNDDAATYFFQKDDPDPETTGVTGGQTITSAGGWQGLLLKVSGSNGGFNAGETVTFSGDMDPNSVAAMAKGTLDSGAVNGWDVGGVSGAELIGSAFTVMFVDGTTATGYLGGNGNQAASIGMAVEGQTAKTTTVTVDGIGSNQPGTYGGTVPEIIVTGDVGDVVRVTLSRGLNPVTSAFADDVADRLANSDPAFPVNNAADFQFFDVTIGIGGTATLPDNAFNWLSPNGGQDFSGTAYTNGFDTAPAVIAASVIDSGTEMPLGATDRVYLTNQGGPVTDGGGGGNVGNEGYYEGISFNGGDGYRFKVQIEDQNANGGQNPGGKWNFLDAPDAEGRQAGFQGDGYYLYGSETSTALNGVQAADELIYTIFIPEDEVGTYLWRQRVSRDGIAENDQQNDIWLNFRKAGTNESIEDYLIEGANEPEPTNQGSIKLFGGPNNENGTWGNATNWDGLPGNPPTQLNITEGGLYEVVIHGRSQGYHVDFWELYKGGTPGTGAGDSAFIATGDTVPTVADPTDDLLLFSGNGTTIEAGDAFQDLDGDDLTFLADFGDIPGAQASINSDTGLITLGDGIALGTYTVTVQASDDDNNSATDSFDVTVAEQGSGGQVTVAIASGADDWEQFGGGGSGDFELGLNSGQQQWAALRFDDIDLPDGAFVTNAVISFTAQESGSDTASFDISMQDTENAGAYGTDALPVSAGRSYIDSFIWNEEAWTAGQSYDTPDLSDFINAVIGNDGVQNGSFGFLFEGNSGSRVADSFESPGDDQPELIITYEFIS